MEEFENSGEGGVDLRQYAINHLHMNKEQIQEKMLESFSKQNSEMSADIMSGNTLQSELQSETEVPISHLFKRNPKTYLTISNLQSSLKILDMYVIHYKVIQLRFRPSTDIENNPWLLLIPIFAGLAIFGYLMKRKLSQDSIDEPLLIVTQPQVNYKELTQRYAKQFIETLQT